MSRDRTGLSKGDYIGRRNMFGRHGLIGEGSRRGEKRGDGLADVAEGQAGGEDMRREKGCSCRGDWLEERHSGHPRIGLICK